MGSIRWRLFAIALFAILPLTGLVLYEVSAQRTIARQDAEQSTLRLVRIAISQENEILEKAKGLLVVLTALPQIQPDQNPEACSRLLVDIFKEFSGYTNIGVATLDGNVYCSAQPLTGTINISDRRYFIDAMNQLDFSVGQYQIGRITGKPGVNFGYPVYRQSELVAIAYVAVDLKALSNLAASASLSPNSTLSVFDSQGTYLVRYPQPERWVGRKLPEAEITALVLNQRREGTAEARGVDGVQRLYGFAPLLANDSPVYISVGIPKTEAYAEANRHLRNSLIVLSVVTIIALGLAWYIGERIIGRSAENAARLAAIVDNTSEAIYTKTLDGKILTWNQGAQQMYGYSPEEIIGQSVRKLVPPNRQTEIDTLLKRLRAGQSVERLETVRRRKDGIDIDVALTITPLRANRDRPVIASVIARDITEHKKIDRMKSDFVSLVSHQLKTPSGIINGYVDNMLYGLTGPLTDRQKEYLERMREVSTKNYALIADLLNVSRIERGVIQVYIQPVPLIAIVEAATKEYQPIYQKKGLALQTKNTIGDTQVKADEQKFAECIKNILNNAWKFTEQGGVTVTMRQSGSQAIVDVVDTGKGMDEAGMKKIFTRDHVLSGSPSPEGSSGLGLYIAKEFMKLQGGDITATSMPGKGSTFTFTIPLA